MDGTALKTRSHQKYQNEKRERESGELQARTLACREIITRIVRAPLPIRPWKCACEINDFYYFC